MKSAGMLGLVIMMVVGAAGCGRNPKPTILQEANRFFDLLRDDRVADAHAMLAEESREATPREALQQGVTALGLTGHQGVVWDSPCIDDDYATIEGVVTTRNGAKLRQELVFFKQGRHWILQMIREPPDPTTLELIAEAQRRQPAPDGMDRLAMETICLLANAIDSGDFTAFHQSTAPLFREQSTPELFQESFDGMASPELGIDWTAACDGTPVFDAPPEVDAEGILHMTGDVPMGEQQLGFELQYVYETPMWMLISFQIRPPL